MGKLRRSQEACWKLSQFRRILITLRIISNSPHLYRWPSQDPFYARIDAIELLFQDWFRGKKDKKAAAFSAIADQDLWWWCYRNPEEFD